MALRDQLFGARERQPPAPVPLSELELLRAQLAEAHAELAQLRAATPAAAEDDYEDYDDLYDDSLPF